MEPFDITRPGAPYQIEKSVRNLLKSLSCRTITNYRY